VLFERSPDTEARQWLMVCDKHSRASRGLRGTRTDALLMEGRRRVNSAVPSGGPQCHSMSLVTHDTLREKPSLPACESSGVPVPPEISITQFVADPFERPLDAAELPSKTATNSCVPLQRLTGLAERRAKTPKPGDLSVLGLRLGKHFSRRDRCQLSSEPRARVVSALPVATRAAEQTATNAVVLGPARASARTGTLTR
jgi:hypothetical protein